MNARTPDRVLIVLIAIVAGVCAGAWAIENWQDLQHGYQAGSGDLP